jgi:formylmethanofuran dehydrogenase subunit E
MEKVSVISLPECSKCEEIKSFLKSYDIPFTEKTLTSEIQTDLVMNDIYFDPPILIINNKYFSYKDFKNDPIEIFDEINASNCNACLEKSSCYLK